MYISNLLSELSARNGGRDCPGKMLLDQSCSHHRQQHVQHEDKGHRSSLLLFEGVGSELQEIVRCFIRTDKMLVDICTKRLNKEYKFAEALAKIKKCTVNYHGMV